MTLNQVVTKTRIDDGDLTFTPATGGSGDNYASFTFKVNDGTVDSAGAYTMTIDVTPTPPADGTDLCGQHGRDRIWQHLGK